MKLLLVLLGAAPLALAAPAAGQSMQGMPGMQGMNMPGMKVPPKKKPGAKQAAKPASKASARTAAKRKPKGAPAKRSPTAGHSGHNMSGMERTPGMDMSGKAMPKHRSANPPAGSSMTGMRGMDKSGMNMPAGPTGLQSGGGNMAGMQMPGGSSAQPMAQDMPGMQRMAGMEGMARGSAGTALPAGNAPAPAPPADHYADRTYSPTEMAAARGELRHEHGGSNHSMVLFNLAEYQSRKGSDGYRWDGEGWFGGDINRLVVKTEGEGAFRRGFETAEVQALYSRAIDPYWNLRGGVRYDFKPNPSRTYATIGIQGLAPYWFELEGALFVSNKGDVLGRFEGYYDQRITQRLILQPRIELNLAAQDVREDRIGSGLTNAELGLRLRYEIKREFAPYFGVSYDRKVGGTARFARADGDRVQATSLVLGIRTWF